MSITESYFSNGTAKQGGGIFIYCFINLSSNRANRVKTANSFFDNNLSAFLPM